MWHDAKPVTLQNVDVRARAALARVASDADAASARSVAAEFDRLRLAHPPHVQTCVWN
jgi:hypothetical protein